MNRCLRQRRVFVRLVSAVFLAALSHYTPAQETRNSQVHWWGGFGLGYGYMHAAAGPAPHATGGVWLEAQLGARLGTHWLTGLELGGLGMQISGSNYDPTNSYSSVYGQAVTHALIVLQYAPRVERGWFFGVGAGELLYDNKALQRSTSNERSGHGSAALARCGYDWKIGGAHVDVDLSYERGNIRLNAPLPGRFNFSVLATGVRVSYHGG